MFHHRLQPIPQIPADLLGGRRKEDIQNTIRDIEEDEEFEKTKAMLRLA